MSAAPLVRMQIDAAEKAPRADERRGDERVFVARMAGAGAIKLDVREREGCSTCDTALRFLAVLSRSFKMFQMYS